MDTHRLKFVLSVFFLFSFVGWTQSHFIWLVVGGFVWLLSCYRHTFHWMHGYGGQFTHTKSPPFSSPPPFTHNFAVICVLCSPFKLCLFVFLPFDGHAESFLHVDFHSANLIIDYIAVWIVAVLLLAHPSPSLILVLSCLFLVFTSAPRQHPPIALSNLMYVEDTSTHHLCTVHIHFARHFWSVSVFAYTWALRSITSTDDPCGHIACQHLILSTYVCTVHTNTNGNSECDKLQMSIELTPTARIRWMHTRDESHSHSRFFPTLLFIDFLHWIDKT